MRPPRRDRPQALIRFLVIGFVGDVLTGGTNHAEAVAEAEGKMTAEHNGQRIEARRKKERQDDQLDAAHEIPVRRRVAQMADDP
jgi:hypothetical protein